MPRDMLMEKREWLLQRHCSLSPRQLALAYALLSLLSFAVALSFYLLGVWQVLFFTVLEMSAVAFAFLYAARHAADYELVELSVDGLLVLSVSAGREQRIHFDPYWTRVSLAATPGALIALEARGARVQLGRFVGEQRRRQFVRELRRALPGAVPG
ncbi:DUF2244 domain-containing protein [Oxalobacteraceae bacterium]|nr:DUF2244 domain-containing protein [Oxalobacteraceae bacterium]